MTEKCVWRCGKEIMRLVEAGIVFISQTATGPGTNRGSEFWQSKSGECLWVEQPVMRLVFSRVLTLLSSAWSAISPHQVSTEGMFSDIYINAWPFIDRSKSRDDRCQWSREACGCFLFNSVLLTSKTSSESICDLRFLAVSNSMLESPR